MVLLQVKRKCVKRTVVVRTPSHLKETLRLISSAVVINILLKVNSYNT